jgi:hypothetical protein
MARLLIAKALLSLKQSHEVQAIWYPILITTVPPAHLPYMRLIYRHEHIRLRNSQD